MPSPDYNNEPTFDISLVIPAFNERQRLGPTLDSIADFLDQKPYRVEIVLVDDGSTDDTVAFTKRYGSRFLSLQIIELSQNQGKGAAVKRGMLAARGSVRFFYDADGSTPIEELDRAMRHHQQGVDVVIGSRSLVDSNRAVRQPAHRHLAGALFRYFVHFLVVPGFKDTQCGFKSFTKQATEAIFPRQLLTRFSFDVELLLLARLQGFRIVEMPITWRDSAETRLSFLKDGLRMFLDLVQIRINRLRGRYRR